MMNGSAGKAPKVSATHIVALYRPTDGRVFHIHEVVIFEGGKALTKEDAEKGALEVARRRGHDVAKLHTLFAGSELPASRGGFRVDKGALVAVAPPARRRRKVPAAK